MTASSSPQAFAYPNATTARRHGPIGYSDYRSFRPWLRDEFAFRCAYCLLRECWGRCTGEFDLDHFTAQACDPSLRVEYENLVYSCHSCNLKKGAAAVPDAWRGLTKETVHVQLDGYVKGLTKQAEEFIDVLFLNSPKWVEWRLSWIRIIDLAAENDAELFHRLMQYPNDLPDLAVLQPDGNFRPEGVEQSYFAQRKRGELPETYLM